MLSVLIWFSKFNLRLDYIVLTSESVIGDHVDLHQSPTFDARHRICPLRKRGKFLKVPFDLFRFCRSNTILMTNRHIILVPIFSILHIRNNRMRASGAKTKSRRISLLSSSLSRYALHSISARSPAREQSRRQARRVAPLPLCRIPYSYRKL